MKRILLFTFIISISIIGRAQFGGNSTYDFLNLSTHARANALGGNLVGLVDSTESGLAYYNPSALRPLMHNQISLSYVDYIKDIRLGNATYVRHFNNIGTFAAGMHFVSYGKFIEALEDGVKTGETFTAGDYALNLIYSRGIWGPISAGVNLKPVYSVYEQYTSFGVAADLGFTYVDSTGNFTAGLVLKNMGAQITTYQNTGVREPLPFDLQAGFSQKFAHAPFRLHFTFQNLLRWNLTDKSTWDFDRKGADEYVAGKSDDFLRQFMRHVVLGAEFIPSQNFSIGIGYNYQRRRELSVAGNPSSIGLSGGFNVKVNKFKLSYAISSYHLAGTSNTFSITTNLSDFL